MDVQYITSTGNEIATEHWSTAGAQPGNPENEPFVKWLTDVASAGDDVPSLFSISYGDEETGVSYAYAQRCSVEFQKPCERHFSPRRRRLWRWMRYCRSIPTFQSCPYVTGVGAVTGGTPGLPPARMWQICPVADFQPFARPTGRGSQSIRVSGDAAAAYPNRISGMPAAPASGYCGSGNTVRCVH